VESTAETIQIILEKSLLQTTGRAAKLAGKHRSVLVCAALREHLKKLELRDAKERGRQGYSKMPPAPKSRRFGKGGGVAGKIAETFACIRRRYLG
jgi:metal-responsive CopG/Arc/MetJ family transcriptional regulator